LALPVYSLPRLLLGRKGTEGYTMPKPRTNQEHVQLIREGKDYYSPRLAINEVVDHLVDGALVFHADAVATPEQRCLDAIGVQVCRELKNRAEMIHALTDRLQAVEAELAAYKTAGNLAEQIDRTVDKLEQHVTGRGDKQLMEMEIADAKFSG
jgi:hypothetical protein